MLCRNVFARGLGRWAMVVVCLAMGVGGAPRALAVDAFDGLDSAARLVPSDAVFYYSLMRNREQFEAVARSRAWARFKAMPFVQMGLAFYNIQTMDPESVPGRINAALKDPEQRQLIDLGVS